MGEGNGGSEYLLTLGFYRRYAIIRDPKISSMDPWEVDDQSAKDLRVGL